MEKKEKKKMKTYKKIILSIIAFVIIIPVVFIAYLSISEYRPKSEEKAVLDDSNLSKKLDLDSEIKLLSWNLGYTSLGQDADFFMDGGQSVKSSSKDQILDNLKEIKKYLENEDADVYLLQEVDRSSTRSYYIDQLTDIGDSLKEYSYSFANNFKVAWVPYPIPMIGKVDSGLATYSKYKIEDAKRIKLPNPFSWPVSLANLKRCLTVNRMDIENTSKQLVVINLHLEAYDSGEGKLLQTKMLKDYIENEISNGNYVIAGGDFNQTIYGKSDSKYPVYEGMWTPGLIDQKDFGNDMTLMMDKTIASCRSLDKPLNGADKDEFQFYIIDGFIVSNNIEVESLNTKDLNFKNSDHNPVELKVKFKK